MPETDKPQDHLHRGIPVSPGVAIGPVHVLKDRFDEPEPIRIDSSEVEQELERWHTALAVTRKEIQDLQRVVGGEHGTSESEIFETHLLILEDVTIIKEVEKAVRSDLISVDYIYYRLMRRHMDALRGLADAYLRERFLDIKDITQRVMRHLRGELLQQPMFTEPVIIVAHDLTPSDTVQLDRSKVLGFAIETGSTLSHAAIIARSLNLPAVVRLGPISDEIHSGDSVLLDGEEGALVLRPTGATLSRYRDREEATEGREEQLFLQRSEPAITRDGAQIIVGANAEFLDEIPGIQDSGAEEIGLFRTEFLYLENPHASEEHLSTVYREVAACISPKKVIFRTLDVGGDKVDPLLAQEPEPNPFLGWRGIRVSLGRPDLFCRQLRAILRSAEGNAIGIMFPMVSGVQEVIDAKRIVQECIGELRSEGVTVPENLEIGAMIEIPGAAIEAESIAREVDFLSLGTNDLIQYSLAVDRLNDRVAKLFQTTHPGVLKLVQMTVDAGLNTGTRVGICGEMASDIALTPLLVGLGLRELSVAAGQIPRIKHAIRCLDASVCAQMTTEALLSTQPEEILEASRQMAKQAYPELFG